MQDLIPNALTSLSIFKSYLGIEDASEDNLLKLCINLSTGFIEGYTKRKFFQKTYVENFSTGKSLLLVKAIPIISISSIQISGANTTYSIQSKANGIIKLESEAESEVEVSYIGGYKIDFSNITDETKHNLPFEIINLANEIASKIYNKRKSQGISNESVEGTNISWEKEITPETLAILNRYSLRSFL
jgi:hypothetical protein